GELVQRLLLDQIGPHSGQLPFGQSLQPVVQERRNGEIEDRIAQEFEPLVVVGREAAMRQRPRQQLAFAELVLQTRLQRYEPSVNAGAVHSTSTVPRISAAARRVRTCGFPCCRRTSPRPCRRSSKCPGPCH